MGRTRTSFPAFRQLLALSALVLAAALPLQAWAVDTDGDGVDDSVDAFPNNPEATADTDHDGKPDSLNWALAPTLGAFTLTSPYSYVGTSFILYPWSWSQSAGTVGANISLPNGTATAELKVNVYVPAGGGNVSFDYRGVTMGYSLLDNGQALITSGAVLSTQNFNTPLAAGFHQLDWKVTASGCSSCGSRGFSLSNLVVQNVKSSVLSEDADDDGDGILDTSDNCPLQANANQLDSDQDSIGNVCDPTPHVPQTITITQAAPLSAAYGTSFTVAATASSGLAVSIAVSGGCSLSGNTVTMISSACTVMYSQSGDASYGAATPLSSTTYPYEFQVDGTYRGSAIQEQAQRP